MNKADLVARIAKEAALTKRQSEKMLEAFMGSIQDALSKGEKITLVGFGTFSAMARSARTGAIPGPVRRSTCRRAKRPSSRQEKSCARR